jgi:hypothetical protein
MAEKETALQLGCGVLLYSPESLLVDRFVVWTHFSLCSMQALESVLAMHGWRSAAPSQGER